jgi:hypothetical protein
MRRNTVCEKEYCFLSPRICQEMRRNTVLEGILFLITKKLPRDEKEYCFSSPRNCQEMRRNTVSYHQEAAKR